MPAQSVMCDAVREPTHHTEERVTCERPHGHVGSHWSNLVYPDGRDVTYYWRDGEPISYLPPRGER